MKLHVLIILIILMFCTGCFSGPRNWFGTKTVNASPKIARESTGAVIGTEVVQGNLKVILDKAKEIEKRTEDEVVLTAAQDIQLKSRESAVLMKDVHKKLKSINRESLGETRWSKGRILLIWLVVIGVALRFALPGVYPAIMRGIGEIISGFVGLVSGKASEFKKDTMTHMIKSSSVNDEDLHSKTLADLDKLRREQ